MAHRSSSIVLAPWLLAASLVTLLAPLDRSAQAQITPDSTLPTIVNSSSGLDYQITGGSQAGGNLFHSFEQFSIPTGGSGFFDNALTIQNIIGRVTGGLPSDIDGLLRANGTANLFLLNPSGIHFGPNAALNLGGSFFASTASSLKFADGTEFSTVNPQPTPLLTVSVPLGPQLHTIPPGSTLSNRGNLRVPGDLSLVADRLDLQGQLVAGRDLTLQAQDSVQIRDTATPFLAQSGRDLTVQGNQGVDILALNTAPQPPPYQAGKGEAAFQSGRNLSLISDGIISGDAHFAGGGEFHIRSASGGLTSFTSRYDPIISSAGNVDIAANYGDPNNPGLNSSLLIESQGSVRIQGTVFIDSPDTVSTFQGEDGVLATQPGLIIRSGQANLVYGGTNQNNPPAFTNDAIPAGITLDSPVRVQPSAQGATVKLTADNGGITFHSINASNITGETVETLN